MSAVYPTFNAVLILERYHQVKIYFQVYGGNGAVMIECSKKSGRVGLSISDWAFVPKIR